MTLNLANTSLSFSDKKLRHEKLYNDENVDPLTIAKSRLELIDDAQKCIEDKSSTDALFWYGMNLITGDEGFPFRVDEGIRLLNEAVIMRNLSAVSVLGDVYSGMYPSVPEETQDIHKAIKFYKKAADQNDGYSSSRLAFLYSIDTEAGKDLRQALDYAEKSIQQGSMQGANLMAHWHFYGDYVQKDFAKVLEYLEMVFDNEENTTEPFYLDILGASYYLYGFMMFYGEGVPENPQEGLAYIERAAGMNNQDALEWLREYDAHTAGHPV